MKKKQEKKDCNCLDPDCRRQLKVRGDGILEVVNHFTCGKVKNIINYSANNSHLINSTQINNLNCKK